MKSLIFILACFLSIVSISQETETTEEFLPIHLEGKEAFLSTKTGEYVFLDHNATDATKLETTNNGVIYTDIKIHQVAKKETISKIAKQYDVSEEEILKQNKLSSNKLSIGQELKIIKKVIVKSSSPVISQGESKIIAKLHPGQTPAGLEVTPPNTTPVVSQNTLYNTNAKTEEVTQKIDVVEDKTIKNIEKSSIENAKSFYIVKKGDNLYNIAKTHGIPLNTLKEINNLDTNNIHIGQKLKLK
ncbi:LysM peptidoglycan-binding domain-containing protein [Lacinutrix sp. C3R15]|uniref:LysM peptidoglycan-binding domain-containing protein n=1 Tax=Flavobacteriaceae TaxID=49546 RepID=UPI001C08BC6B|nr:MULTISPECIES: LysM peptidoglycan-binding domain-containing protein [Flavobacteriaceae]MBU2940303.1 LysM peptidoglycan-binding domain-containing protein [Lacinutrix sp. C3R15]MDO6623623.1 LysM peptidoglycan-binding domain-containing protein [Oceanihabitans sp. 1_MG-2023]